MDSGAAIGKRKRKVMLKSFDNVEYEVEEAAALQSVTLKEMIEDDDAWDGNAFPLPNIDSSTLANIIQYCEKHASSAAADELRSWDANYIDIDEAALYHLFLGADYMNIGGLLDLCCQQVANMIKGKSPEDIRKTFNIKSDLPPDQEAEIRKEHPWVFD